jgi:hypothetical protein
MAEAIHGAFQATAPPTVKRHSRGGRGVVGGSSKRARAAATPV